MYAVQNNYCFDGQAQNTFPCSFYYLLEFFKFSADTIYLECTRQEKHYLSTIIFHPTENEIPILSAIYHYHLPHLTYHIKGNLKACSWCNNNNLLYHQQHSTIDTTPQLSSMTPLLDKTANENPSPPLQKRQQQQQQQQSKPQSHREEQHEHGQEEQAQKQRDASAFMTAFLRGAASGHRGDDDKISLTVPTKISDHDVGVVV